MFLLVFGHHMSSMYSSHPFRPFHPIFSPWCFLNCHLIGCELPKPQIEVTAGMDIVRQKGIEVYTSQFNSSAGLTVYLPVYPAFLHWFNDRGKWILFLKTSVFHFNHYFATFFSELLNQFQKRIVFAKDVVKASQELHTHIMRSANLIALVIKV